MEKQFEVLFLEDAFEFLSQLDKKHFEKILYNIRKAQLDPDAELFKKLTVNIWEFRTLFQGLHYRLLAFWDKTNTDSVLVISTHGLVKKKSKIPYKEIKKAEKIRLQYFTDKKKIK